MTLAVLLSGQGGQHPGMFDLTADHPAAQDVFAQARLLLGADPREIARAGGARLNENRTGQIIVCVAALAAWTIVEAARPARAVVVGYSVGDLAAWGCAGRFAPETILRLAAARAEAMDAAAAPGHGLAGIRGVATARINTMARARDCHLAILNAPDSVVVGGECNALEGLCAEALAAGAHRAVLLPVHTPSHTPLLAKATEQFRESLMDAPKLRPRGGPRLLSGLDGMPVFDAEAGAEKLALQISHTIDWAACLEAILEDGADAVLELGPGHALATMARSALPNSRLRAIEDFRSIAGVTDWIRES